MTLQSLRKPVSPQKPPKKNLSENHRGITREKVAFVSSAPLKMNAFAADIKKAKRDQSFLLKLNYYEIDLLDEVSKNSGCRSKQEFIRNILIPAMEQLRK